MNHYNTVNKIAGLSSEDQMIKHVVLPFVHFVPARQKFHLVLVRPEIKNTFVGKKRIYSNEIKG